MSAMTAPAVRGREEEAARSRRPTDPSVVGSRGAGGDSIGRDGNITVTSLLPPATALLVKPETPDALAMWADGTVTERV